MDEEKEGKKPTRLFKAKKYFASKTASSKAGRKAVESFLGEAGTNLINCLEAAAAKTCGQKKAKELICIILKLAFKTKIVYDEKLITRKEQLDFVEPINSLAMLLYKQLLPKPNRDVTKLTLKFAQMQEMVTTLLRKHIKPSNVEAGQEVFRYFGGEPFLDYLYNANECAKERQVLIKNLQVVMRTELKKEHLLPMPVICKTKDCGEEALPVDGIFMGSSRCVAHHATMYTQLVREPSILHFLTNHNTDPYDPFYQEWAPKECPANTINFIISVVNYTGVQTNIMKIFAEELFKKYVDPAGSHAVDCLSPATVEEIRQNMRDLGITRDIFEIAQMQVLAVLEPIFQQRFLNTEAFSTYMEKFKLPSYYEHESKDRN